MGFVPMMPRTAADWNLLLLRLSVTRDESPGVGEQRQLGLLGFVV
jgi:hypothetical protein